MLKIIGIITLLLPFIPIGILVYKQRYSTAILPTVLILILSAIIISIPGILLASTVSGFGPAIGLILPIIGGYYLLNLHFFLYTLHVDPAWEKDMPLEMKLQKQFLERKDILVQRINKSSTDIENDDVQYILTQLDKAQTQSELNMLEVLDIAENKIKDDWFTYVLKEFSTPPPIQQYEYTFLRGLKKKRSIENH